MIDDKHDKSVGTAQNGPYPELWIDEHGIIHEHHHEEFVTKNLAMYVASERKRLAGREKKPLLVTFNRLVGFSADTRDMDLDIVLTNVLALAYAADPETPEGRQTWEVYNTFFTVTPWPLPVQMFNSEQEAVAWLKTFL